MDSKFPNSRDEKHDCFAFFLVPTLKCLHCREGFQSVKKISPPVCCVAQYQVLRYINPIFHQGCTDLTLSTMDAQLSSCINLCSAEDHTDPKVTFCHPEELWASNVTCSCKKGQVGLAACPKATVHPGTTDLQPMLSSKFSRKHNSGIKPRHCGQDHHFSFVSCKASWAELSS